MQQIKGLRKLLSADACLPNGCLWCQKGCSDLGVPAYTLMEELGCHGRVMEDPGPGTPLFLSALGLSNTKQGQYLCPFLILWT